MFCLGLDEARGAAETWADLLAVGKDVEPELVAELCKEVHPSDDALIIYTSGSTALPKGVLHVQRTAALQGWRFAEFMRLGAERVWTAQPFFWTAGIAMSLGGTFASGSTLLLQPYFDPGAALEIMERERATLAHAWAHQQKAMAEHPDAAPPRPEQPDQARRPQPAARARGDPRERLGYRGFLRPLGGLHPGRDDPGRFAPRAARGHERPRAPGRAAAHRRSRRPAQPLPTGEHGEIAIKGAVLMRGYYKVLPEQWQDADGYFHCSDGGSLDAEGYLHWTGRIDDLIKTGGANVSPLEIERALETFTALRAARAVAVPHPTLGQAIVLCAVRAEGSAIDEEGVRAFLQAAPVRLQAPAPGAVLRARRVRADRQPEDPRRPAARRRARAPGRRARGDRGARLRGLSRRAARPSARSSRSVRAASRLKIDASVCGSTTIRRP